jgi:hypothetical protein
LLQSIRLIAINIVRDPGWRPRARSNRHSLPSAWPA